MRHDDPPAGRPDWQQINVRFAEGRDAERGAAAHLGPALAHAESTGLITAWFFIRKPWWRFRYLPAGGAMAGEARELLHEAARRTQDAGHAAQWVENVYEPETHAFGGDAGMTAAHELFHADSRHILTRLTRTGPVGDDTAIGGEPGDPGRRREVSVLLCAALIRAAGQDRYEQGDVWAKVVDLRKIDNRVGGAQPDRWAAFTAAVDRLVTVDTGPATALRTGGLRFADDWLAAFEQAGRTLRTLSDEGLLTRGIRAVAAHHVIFHWNRIGLPHRTQANLALAAKEAVFADRDA